MVSRYSCGSRNGHGRKPRMTSRTTTEQPGTGTGTGSAAVGWLWFWLVFLGVLGGLSVECLSPDTARRRHSYSSPSALCGGVSLLSSYASARPCCRGMAVFDGDTFRPGAFEEERNRLNGWGPGACTPTSYPSYQSYPSYRLLQAARLRNMGHMGLIRMPCRKRDPGMFSKEGSSPRQPQS